MLELRHRSLTCTVAALLFVSGATAAFAQPQAPDRPLRVMSYNIKHGQTNLACTQAPRPSPDCGLDLQASIEVIRRFNPDIVGMQEIDRFWSRSDHLDEPAVISQALGLPHVCYAAN